MCGCFYIFTLVNIILAAPMPEHMSLFLALTDYVEADCLTLLSADTLHDLVCGVDGHYLDHLARKAECECVEFVSQPQPGFRIVGSDEARILKAKVLVEGIMFSISEAANCAGSMTSTSSSQGVEPPPPSSRARSRIPSNKYKAKHKPSPHGYRLNSSTSFYHPLYSSGAPSYQYMDGSTALMSPAAIFMLPTPVLAAFSDSVENHMISPGLLPLPVMYSSGEFALDDSEEGHAVVHQQLTEKQCQDLIQSPYLSLARRRKPVVPTPPKLFSDFDKEIAEYLPGIPGVRQSKEYKRIRRKISEIDDLVKSGTELDVCRNRKVSKRAQYVEMIKRLLQGLPAVPEEQSPTTAEEEEIVFEEKPFLEDPPTVPISTLINDDPVDDHQQLLDASPFQQCSPTAASTIDSPTLVTFDCCESDYQDAEPPILDSNYSDFFINSNFHLMWISLATAAVWLGDVVGGVFD